MVKAKNRETTGDVFSTSYSRVRCWRRCRRQHWYRYVRKIQAKRVPKPLIHGRIIHEMLDAEANRRDPFAILIEYEKKLGSLFRSEAEYYGDILNTCRFIFLEYQLYYKHRADRFVSYVRFKGQRAEHRASSIIADGVQLNFVIDAIAERSDGTLWLVENKNTSTIPTESTRYRDLQTTLYIPRLEELGLPEVDGICWNYLRRKEPSRPEMTAKGKLSTRKIDTLPSVFVDTLEKLGVDPRDYEEQVSQIAERRSSWFVRRFMPINERVIQELEKEFIDTTREIIANPDCNTRTIDRHCDWCEFEPLCRSELLNTDHEFVMERQYESKRREDKPEKEDGD